MATPSSLSLRAATLAPFLAALLFAGTAVPGPGTAQEAIRGSTAAPVQKAPPPPPATPAQPPADNALEHLTERDQSLDAREKEIQRREKMMKAAAAQLDQKVTELKRMQSTLEGRLTPPASR